MTRHRTLIGLSVLFVSLFVTTKAPAKESNFAGDQNRKSNAVVFVSRQELLLMAKSLRLTVRRVKVSTREKNFPSKGCGCSLTPEDDFGFGSCLTDCLRSWGVSAATVAGCGVVCASDNLVGCAICAGVAEWVVLGCAQYCVWKDVDKGPGDILGRNSQTRGSHQAKLLLRHAPTRSKS